MKYFEILGVAIGACLIFLDRRFGISRLSVSHPLQIPGYPGFGDKRFLTPLPLFADIFTIFPYMKRRNKLLKIPIISLLASVDSLWAVFPYIAVTWGSETIGV